MFSALESRYNYLVVKVSDGPQPSPGSAAPKPLGASSVPVATAVSSQPSSGAVVAAALKPVPLPPVTVTATPALFLKPAPVKVASAAGSTNTYELQLRALKKELDGKTDEQLATGEGAVPWRAPSARVVVFSDVLRRARMNA